MEEVLALEREKYAELKEELAESGSPGSLRRKAGQLRSAIAEL